MKKGLFAVNPDLRHSIQGSLNSGGVREWLLLYLTCSSQFDIVLNPY